MELEKSAKDASMSDTALAAMRIRQVAGGRGMDEKMKAVLERVYGVLARKYPRSKWTRRRVRSLWEAKAARVDYREIAEMEAIIAEAKEKHAAYIRETARQRDFAASLIAGLELQDAEFHRPSIEGLGGIVRGMDLPRVEGGDE